MCKNSSHPYSDNRRCIHHYWLNIHRHLLLRQKNKNKQTKEAEKKPIYNDYCLRIKHRKIEVSGASLQLVIARKSEFTSVIFCCPRTKAISQIRHINRHLFAEIICSEKRTVFRDRSSRKTVSFEDQIISNEDSSQMEAIVIIIFKIFFAARGVLKIGEYHSVISQF